MSISNAKLHKWAGGGYDLEVSLEDKSKLRGRIISFDQVAIRIRCHCGAVEEISRQWIDEGKITIINNQDPKEVDKKIEAVALGVVVYNTENSITVDVTGLIQARIQELKSLLNGIGNLVNKSNYFGDGEMSNDDTIVNVIAIADLLGKVSADAAKRIEINKEDK